MFKWLIVLAFLGLVPGLFVLVNAVMTRYSRVESESVVVSGEEDSGALRSEVSYVQLFDMKPPRLLAIISMATGIALYVVGILLVLGGTPEGKTNDDWRDYPPLSESSDR